MKFYNSIGPNPRVVKMFMAEKGIDIPRVEVDLMGGENRQGSHLARNPSGQTPTLELDDGSFLAEITAICEYLDEKHPSQPLIGTTAEERAVTRMSPATPSVSGCSQAAADLKTLAQERITWLDGLIASNAFVAGNRFTLADILLYCTLDFGRTVGQPLNRDNANIAAWFDRVNARPSAEASKK